MVDTAALKRSLEALLAEIRSRGLSDVGVHLRFPTRDTAQLFVGSTLGREFWETPGGRGVVEALLADEQIAHLHGPPPDWAQQEIWGRVASLMDHLLATGTEVTAEAVEALREELVLDVTFVRAQLVRGLEAPADPIAVNDSLFVMAADPESLREVAAGLFDAEFVTAPRDADGLLVLVSSAERESAGHLAPSWAHGMSAIVLRQLAHALWLATGVEPSPVADWYAEQARLPSMGSPSRTLADVSERGASLPPWAPESIVPERVRGAFQRTYMHPWMDAETEFDDDSVEALRACSILVDTALGSADGGVNALLSFAAADALLSVRRDGEGVIVQRIARLIGSDVEQRRRCRTVVQALYDMRGEVAHGRRPAWAQISRFLERPIDPDELDQLAFSQLQADLKWRLIRFLRALFGSYLWVAVDVDADGTARPGLPKSAIIELTTRAVTGSAEAQVEIDSLIPPWLRDPF